MGPGCRRRQALFASLLAALAAVGASTETSQAACGGLGQACCCEVADHRGTHCCRAGMACTVFAGKGFGLAAMPQALCLPASPTGCGAAGQPCCITARTASGAATATCSAGVHCIPSSSITTGSRPMFDRLAGNAAAALSSAAVTGMCSASAECGAAYSRCGTAAGCGDASCPGGFYCAGVEDTGNGDRCMRLPDDAGKPGGECMPNNLPGAPTVKSSQLGGREVAVPFCPGSAVCFTPIGGDRAGFNLDKAPSAARQLATRISGTRCVEVPAKCGTGAGSPCCYSGHNMVTDKPLAAAAWGGSPCKDNSLWCKGNYIALADGLGTCKANPACGGPNQPCCRYSSAEMAGSSCPGLGRPSRGYCSLERTCVLCPQLAVTVEEIVRCA